MDVYGPKSKVSNILLGKYIDMGETYQRRFEGYSGHVEYIRLYQEGVDGMRIVKVTMEDIYGCVYTFVCNCWIQTDQPADDSKASWILQPESFKWTVYVYIDTHKYAGSKDSLYMDVYGPKWKVSNILLGKYFDMGETYQRRFEGYSGHVEYIRLYQEGVDGMRIVKVTMEDIYGCVYTFVCNCWIQTDQPEDDSKASWILQPEMV
ncbi:lipoxygenase homology domain-containing protein 1-like [Argopecten irradians]|uniref:lipoxygenase homology domain-containing protein 1-like n=1 Tax=Argopecten irradians TaxID=31199 RepID=UPI00371E7021